MHPPTVHRPLPVPGPFRPGRGVLSGGRKLPREIVRSGNLYSGEPRQFFTLRSQGGNTLSKVGFPAADRLGRVTDLRLILASASPARTKLLTEAGIAHQVLVSEVDEDAVTASYGVTDPHDTALLLARAKAEAVAALPDADGALVLGCDSVFELDGEPYGKPHEREIARERLRKMSGRHGVLHTGHWLVDCRATAFDATAFDAEDPENHDAGSGATVGAVASAAVHFAQLSDAEIDAYVATGEPLHVAGSFTIDSLGGAFIERVDGDPHAVVGLSVSTLRRLLANANVQITDLWN
jgi:septum formation protein